MRGTEVGYHEWGRRKTSTIRGHEGKMIGHGYQRIETERPWVCPQLHYEINIHGSLQLKSGSPGLLSIMTLVEFKPTAKLDPTEILLVLFRPTASSAYRRWEHLEEMIRCDVYPEANEGNNDNDIVYTLWSFRHKPCSLFFCDWKLNLRYVRMV